MDDQNLILEQMEQTRGSLSKKLEMLEDSVGATVKGATSEVAETVEDVTGSVQQTVEAVTESVQETVETVKETVEDTLTVVKESVSAIRNIFDIPGQVQRHPWAMVGGSVAAGFVLAETVGRRRHSNRPPSGGHTSSRRSVVENGTPGTNGNGKPADSENNVNPDRKAQPADSESILDKLAPEMAKLKGLALGALMGMVREMVTSEANDDLGASLGEIIDSITEKIGGTPVHSHKHASLPS